ncbi:MAG: phosphate ABC transporter permease subunit PstC [Deltaproteobacteria bacterium]|nr:phosphate ABC transporter permease subunit PstC [Deltaproteobacteria bacterium]
MCWPRIDPLFSFTLKVIALGVFAFLALIAFFLFYSAWPAILRFGWEFLRTSTWDPVKEIFGALPVIYGTVISSLFAVAIAAPLSVGIALFLNELSPRKIATPIGFLVEMLAAIPSVVYGLWGIFVLAPWLGDVVQPFLGKWLGALPLFQGPPYGVGMLAAIIILAIMITPTISSISKEVFQAIPRSDREAALALGATRWEMMKLSVLGRARAGIFGAVILGLGRALGETMAVTMVIGNRSEISASLFAPGQTMASVIANEYAEATSDLHVAALAEIGLVLFGVTFLINAIARLIIWKVAQVKVTR